MLLLRYGTHTFEDRLDKYFDDDGVLVCRVHHGIITTLPIEYHIHQ